MGINLLDFQKNSVVPHQTVEDNLLWNWKKSAFMG